jgi:hypothetical protein
MAIYGHYNNKNSEINYKITEYKNKFDSSINVTEFIKILSKLPSNSRITINNSGYKYTDEGEYYDVDECHLPYNSDEINKSKFNIHPDLVPIFSIGNTGTDKND